MRIRQYIVLLGGLLLWACSKNMELSDKGTLQIRIGVPDAIQVEQSRAAKGNGNISDGGGMEDLTLILVDPQNVVVSKKTYTYTDGAWSGDGLQSFEENQAVTTRFTDLDISDYWVYVYANTKNCMDFWGDIQTKLDAVSIGNAFTLADEVLPKLTDTATPLTDPDKPMLLTAAQKINIGVGTTTAVVELLRPLVSFELQVHNHSNKDLKINSLSFENFNPQTSYLTPHENLLEESGSNVYRSLPALSSTPITISSNEKATVYQAYLYESNALNTRYQFDMNLGLDVKISTSKPVLNETTPLTRETGDIRTKTIYALRNHVTGHYLVDNGSADNGTMSVVNVINNNNYLIASWEFSGTNSGCLENVGTKNKFYRSTKSNTPESVLFFTRIPDPTDPTKPTFQIYYQGTGTYNYYLCHQNDNLIYDYQYSYGGTDNKNWELYSINTMMQEIEEEMPPSDITDQQISVIQGDGTAIPMTGMYRNQKVVVVVNVYYEEISGVFRFYIEPWSSKTLGVEFN